MPYLNFDAKLLGRCFKADLRLVDELGELMLGAAAGASLGLVVGAVGNVTDEPWGERVADLGIVLDTVIKRTNCHKLRCINM